MKQAGQRLLGIAFALLTATASALTPDMIDADAADRTAFDGIMRKAAEQDFGRLPYGQLVQSVAVDEALQGRDYAKHPLDGAPDHERLQAGFAHFDCVTFVETVLALSETIALREHEFGRYAGHLAALRCRDGEPAYCERLHYFSDWIQRNIAVGRLEDMTVAVADAPENLAFAVEPQGLNFLSRNAASIPSLADWPEHRACVRERELALTAMLQKAPDGTPGFAYIPRARLAGVFERLQAGDILAWVADQPGLDVVHVGIVVGQGRASPGFAHASLRTGGVSIAPDLLAYSRSLPRQRGVLVLRPRAPQIQ